MALHASSKSENIKSSIEKYIFDNLNSTFTVDWQGNESVDVEGADEYIQPTIIKAAKQYGRQVTGSTKGNVVEYLININMFLKKGSVTNAHRLSEIRDTVAQYFEEDQVIPIMNYAGDSSHLGNAIIREIITDRELDTSSDFRLSDAGGGLYYQWNYTFIANYVQQF